MRAYFGEETVPSVLYNGTTGTDPIYTSYVDMQGFGEVTFLVTADEALDANVALQAYQRKPDGSGAKVITGFTATLAADDDDKVGILTVDTQDLDDGFSEVALLMTPAGDEDIVVLALQCQAQNVPVSRTGLAFYRDRYSSS